MAHLKKKKKGRHTHRKVGTILHAGDGTARGSVVGIGGPHSVLRPHESRRTNGRAGGNAGVGGSVGHDGQGGSNSSETGHFESQVRILGRETRVEGVTTEQIGNEKRGISSWDGCLNKLVSSPTPRRTKGRSRLFFRFLPRAFFPYLPLTAYEGTESARLLCKLLKPSCHLSAPKGRTPPPSDAGTRLGSQDQSLI